jgi:hypothetical protein
VRSAPKSANAAAIKAAASNLTPPFQTHPPNLPFRLTQILFEDDAAGKPLVAYFELDEQVTMGRDPGGKRQILTCEADLLAGHLKRTAVLQDRPQSKNRGPVQLRAKPFDDGR